MQCCRENLGQPNFLGPEAESDAKNCEGIQASKNYVWVSASSSCRTLTGLLLLVPSLRVSTSGEIAQVAAVRDAGVDGLPEPERDDVAE